MTKPTAKFRIEGEDATGAAFRSALGNAQKTADRMQRQFSGAFAALAGFGVMQGFRKIIALNVEANEDFARSIGGVKKSFTELFTLDPSGMRETVVQLDRLALVLKDPAIQDGADKLVGSLVRVGSKVVEGWALLAGEVGRVAQSFREGNDALDDAYERQEKLSRQIGETHARMQEIRRENRESSAGYEAAAKRLEAYRVELAETRAEIQRLLNVKSASTQLEEIRVNLPRLAKPVPDVELEVIRGAGKRIRDEDYFENLHRLTQTSTERQIAELDRVESALGELREAGRITAEQYTARWSEALEEAFPPIEAAGQKIGNTLKDAFEQVEPEVQYFKFMVEDALADFVSTGKLRVGDFVNAFITEFARIKVIQPWLDSLLKPGGFNPFDAVGKLFGFADGGRPPVGRASIVGERGPELFVPDRAGTIIPNHKLGGSATVTIHNHIDARGATTDFVKALPSVLAQNNAQVKADIVQWLGRRGMA